MTGAELGLCISAMLASSASQLFIKAASAKGPIMKSIALLGFGAALFMGSTLLVVAALRSVQLSQLVSFAAGAYVLVPIGGHFIFGERLLPRFWLGVALIVGGILCTIS